MPKLTVAVIFGGRSQEHEVSLGSGAQIIEVLEKNKKKYNIIPVGITRNGKWFTGKDAVAQFQKGKTTGLQSVLLASDGSRLMFVMDKGKIFKKIKIDVAFPWVLGPYGEDGTMQGLLEMADIPYVGCPVFASACGFDKLTTKAFMQAFGIPQVRYAGITRSEWHDNKKVAVERVLNSLPLPMFVKPSSCGSSIGVTKVKQAEKLEAAIREAFKYDNNVIVEEGVQNAIEIECSVLGNDDLTISIPGQVEYEGEFYDFNAKYLSTKWGVHIPPKLPEKTIAEIRALAGKIFTSIQGAGASRIDFMVDGDTKQVYFNELNTVPGFRSMSMFTRLLIASGVSYDKAIEKLIVLAREKYKEKTKRQTDFSSGTDWYKKK